MTSVALPNLVRSICGVLFVVLIANPVFAQEATPQQQLEAAAGSSLGGPGSAQAQQEQDRLRRMQDSRLPELDLALDPPCLAHQLAHSATKVHWILSIRFDVHVQLTCRLGKNIDRVAHAPPVGPARMQRGEIGAFSSGYCTVNLRAKR